MGDLEQKLAELENAIIDADKSVHQDIATMPKGRKKNGGLPNVANYFYIAAAVIPLLTGLILYFAKPKFILKKRKICMRSLIQWTMVTTLILWTVLFAIAYFGGYTK